MWFPAQHPIAQWLTETLVSGREGTVLPVLQQLAQLAQPAVSGFHVAACLQDIAGNWAVGVNVEFPGVPYTTTIHAEQFALALMHTHSVSRPSLQNLWVTAAPCGHCRQILTEPDPWDASLLTLHFPAPAFNATHRPPDEHPQRFIQTSLSALMPFGFESSALNHSPLSSLPLPSLDLAEGAPHHSELSCQSVVQRILQRYPTLSTDIRSHLPPLVQVARRGYRPYTIATPSKSSASAGFEREEDAAAQATDVQPALMFLGKNGQVAYGTLIESVAFNPTLTPLTMTVAHWMAQSMTEQENLHLKRNKLHIQSFYNLFESLRQDIAAVVLLQPRSFPFGFVPELQAWTEQFCSGAEYSVICL